jgi:hypothetical protein
MTRPSSKDTTASRLARASEEVSILSHELAIAVKAWGLAQPLAAPDPARPADAVAGILRSVSERLNSQALAIAEIAFVVAEDAVSSSGDPRAERSAATLGRVSRVVEPVFEMAEELAGHLLSCYRTAHHMGRPFTSADLTELDEPIRHLLEENEQLATGAGVAIAPGALADRRLWMQWWVRGSGRTTQLLPQLDPARPRFYDYTNAVWFAEPARELAPHLARPHFDEGGTDNFMITATIPTVADGRMIGLACAEMTLERLGKLVLPALTALPVPAALITPDRWVAASTHPGMLPGEQAPADLLGETGVHQAAVPFGEAAAGVTIARSPALAWWLLVDWR